MNEWFEQVLSVMLAALGLVSVPDAATLGVAIALVAVAALIVAVVLSVGPALDAGAPHPLRAIDASALLTQSDPDAAGHPRPRAPGTALAA
ncbi:DUF6412 domain-containing protein [Microbacterium sp. 179-I 3D4 NHS]|uniref:DUF6412 domain-containing protein n=1 Tax=Microbacterium sp. 179-I 3D4 NHS TaxID=3142381 RepID=UPI00399EF701